MTIGSLFSGIGGLELGLERAGLGPVLWQAERDAYCRAVLRRHWPSARRFSDVKEVGDGATRVDVVCGGFPCQPVSLAGRRLAQLDERWLWPEFVRVVRAVEPRVVVIENVPGLRTAGLRDVLADLADLGFDAEWSCIAAGEDPRRTHGWPHAGAPHERRRIFLVATHPDRVRVRHKPGWLGRACWEGASVSRDARSARAADDANVKHGDRRNASAAERRSNADLASRRTETVGTAADSGSVSVRQRTDESRGWVSNSAWSGGGEEAVGTAADPGSARLERSDERAEEQRDDLRRGQREEAVGVGSNADGQGQSQPRWTDRAVRGWASDSSWRHAPPAVRGMDDGPSDGLDDSGHDGSGRDRGEAREPATQAPDTWRVSACGNAVVPQVAEIVGRAIVDACEWRAA